MTKQILAVKGMHCKACTMLITEALEDAGAKDVKVALDEKKQTGAITLDSALTKAQLKTLIEAEGAYTVN
jgi:copper chaperone CopZ